MPVLSKQIVTWALCVSLPALAGCGANASGAGKSTDTAKAPPAHRATVRAAERRSVPLLIPPSNAPGRSVHVPVLTYHRVVKLPAVGQPDLIVDPANFATESAALAHAGYHTITETQLFDSLYRGARLPHKPIIITFDDGYVDDVRTILPDLERFHMVATFFVITGRMREPGFLTAGQIRQLDRAGMDVGDHTAHHVDLRLLTPAQLRVETAGSRQVLERVLGHPVYFFAYPFGAYDAAVVRAIRSAGFTIAYTTAAGSTETTAAPLTMPRIHVGRSATATGLLSLLAGS